MKVYQLILIYFAISNTVQAIGLYCDEFVRNYPYISRVEESVITSLNVIEKNQQISWTSGCYHHTDAVYIESKTVKCLPQGFDEHIGNNIKVLSVISSELKEVNRTDLLQFKNLIVLNFTDNNLEIIEENLFKYNTKLQLIDLSKNPLKIVSSDAFFTSLSMLKAVNFTSCSCLNGKDSNQNDIEDVLYYKNCSETFIDDITKSNLDATSKLLLISLKNYSEYENATISLKCVNKESTTCRAVLEVKTPNSNFFKNATNNDVTDLIIHNQKIVFVPFGLSTIMPKLKAISITNTGIFTVTSRNFENLFSLKDLTLKNNEFSQLIGDNFGNLTSLTSIDLSFNQLERLNDDSFVNLIHLESINLKKNYITELNWRLVKNLKHLKNFDISDNQLTKISTKIVGFLRNPIEKFSFVDNLYISMAYPNNNWQKIKETILERCLKPTPMSLMTLLSMIIHVLSKIS